MRYLVLVVWLMLSCKTKHHPTHYDDFIPDFSMGPPTLLYTTKADYSDLVPVLLSADKTRIVGYPGLSDLQTGTGFPLPTALRDGYYLDNRGVGKDVAFLKLTYAEYASLETLPPGKEMYTWILDKDPLISLCDCGSRKAFTHIETQLNGLIESGKLKTVCRVLK